MTQNAGVAAERRWSDQVSLGVLASSVPRDVIDDAVAAAGRGAKRSDGKLPPHVMVYFGMAMALFADDDYEEVAARLAGTLGSWGCWDARWGPPTSGGITRARERLGFEPVRDIFARVAVPVADPLTRGAFLGHWRLMAIDGFEWDAPDTPGNAAAFGYPGSGRSGRRSRRCGSSPSASAARMRWQTRRSAASRARAPGSSRWPASSARGWRRTGC